MSRLLFDGAKISDSDLFDGITSTPKLDFDVSGLQSPIKTLITSLHSDLGLGLEAITAPLDFGGFSGFFSPISKMFEGFNSTVDDFFTKHFPTYLVTYYYL